VIFTLDDDVVAPAGGGAVNVGVTALEAGTRPTARSATSRARRRHRRRRRASTSARRAGGVDEESDDDYLDRLASALTLLAPRPILPNDFAVMAQQVPGVGRATAIDLYQPGTSDGPPGRSGHPLAGAAGASGRAALRDGRDHRRARARADRDAHAGVWDELNARREVNFLEYVIAPKYQTIDVQATVKAYPGRTPPTCRPRASR
jgi:hypothetical protein